MKQAPYQSRQRAAFSFWERRIAPVFDTAPDIRIIEVEARSIVAARDEKLTEDQFGPRGLMVTELGIDVLVCGAVSRPLHELLSAYGIQVIPFVAGELDEVIGAWLGGQSLHTVFAMPGCCGRWRGSVMGRKSEEVSIMQGKGFGSGRGLGGGGRQRGGGLGSRSGGRGAFAGTSFCVCPQCGHREPHQRGQACIECTCPKCGVKLVRE